MKRVLLVDAVEAPAERALGPTGSVEDWFGKHLNQLPDIEVETFPASSPGVADVAEDSAGIIISGSPRDAWADTPDVLDLLALVERLLAGRCKILGVCFGHQLLGRALGGDVRRNPAGWEVGSVTLELTPAGLASPLFTGFASHFAAIQSHRDAVLSIPSSAKLLAQDAHTPIQAFSFEERAFGVQFHPEMDGEILRQVWAERRERLRDQMEFDLDQALDSADADASRVIHNFVAMLS